MEICALGPNTEMISLFQVSRKQNTQKKEKRIAQQATLFFVYIASVGITNQVFMAPQTLITCPLT